MLVSVVFVVDAGSLGHSFLVACVRNEIREPGRIATHAICRHSTLFPTHMHASLASEIRLACVLTCKGAESGGVCAHHGASSLIKADLHLEHQTSVSIKAPDICIALKTRISSRTHEPAEYRDRKSGEEFGLLELRC